METKKANKYVNEFADKFIVVRNGHLEFRAKYSEFETWLERLLEEEREEVLIKARDATVKDLQNIVNELLALKPKGKP